MGNSIDDRILGNHSLDESYSDLSKESLSEAEFESTSPTRNVGGTMKEPILKPGYCTYQPHKRNHRTTNELLQGKYEIDMDMKEMKSGIPYQKERLIKKIGEISNQDEAYIKSNKGIKEHNIWKNNKKRGQDETQHSIFSRLEHKNCKYITFNNQRNIEYTARYLASPKLRTLCDKIFYDNERKDYNLVFLADAGNTNVHGNKISCSFNFQQENTEGGVGIKRANIELLPGINMGVNPNEKSYDCSCGKFIKKQKISHALNRHTLQGLVQKRNMHQCIFTPKNHNLSVEQLSELKENLKKKKSEKRKQKYSFFNWDEDHSELYEIFINLTNSTTATQTESNDLLIQEIYDRTNYKKLGGNLRKNLVFFGTDEQTDRKIGRGVYIVVAYTMLVPPVYKYSRFDPQRIDATNFILDEDYDKIISQYLIEFNNIKKEKDIYHKMNPSEKKYFNEKENLLSSLMKNTRSARTQKIKIADKEYTKKQLLDNLKGHIRTILKALQPLQNLLLYYDLRRKESICQYIEKVLKKKDPNQKIYNQVMEKLEEKFPAMFVRKRNTSDFLKITKYYFSFNENHENNSIN